MSSKVFFAYLRARSDKGNKISKIKNLFERANSLLSGNCESSADKFQGLRSHVDGTVQLRHGESIGMGSREYELIEV